MNEKEKRRTFYGSRNSRAFFAKVTRRLFVAFDKNEE